MIRFKGYLISSVLVNIYLNDLLFLLDIYLNDLLFLLNIYLNVLLVLLNDICKFTDDTTAYVCHVNLISLEKIGSKF